MESQPKSVSKFTTSFGLSLAICSLLNALLVIAKEKSPALQATMKKLTGHHWITHSTVVILLFIALGWLLSRFHGGKGLSLPVNRLIITIATGTITAGALIIGFYLFAD